MPPLGHGHRQRSKAIAAMREARIDMEFGERRRREDGAEPFADQGAQIYVGKSRSEVMGTAVRRGRRRTGRGVGEARRAASSRSSARAWPMVAAMASRRWESEDGPGRREGWAC